MENFVIEASPHIKSGANTRKIMLSVLLALLPATAAGAVIFGPRALILVAVCAVTSVLSEYVFELITKKENTVGDLSAAVTGVLLGLNLPPSLPIYMAVIGSAAAVVVVKQFFGGLGQNFANPAITARIILMLSFGKYMTTWTAPFAYLDGTDAVSCATVLSSPEEMPSYLDLFLGNRAGCIGETCTAALLAGGVFLCLIKAIDPLPPIVFIGTAALCSLAAGRDVLTDIMSGGLILGTFFMATDYATTPITVTGRVIFSLGCGLITSAVRLFGVYPEGVSYSILLMNILTPLIDRYIMPVPFGTKKGAAKR